MGFTLPFLFQGKRKQRATLMQLVLRMRATRCTESLYGFAARFAKVVLHKNCAGHSAHPAQCKLCGKAPLKPPAGLWYNNKERKLRWKVRFCSCFPYKRKRCTMSQYQAGTLVVYGNLGVHEIEAVGPQSFCGEPAGNIIPSALIFPTLTTRAISPRPRRAFCAR